MHPEEIISLCEETRHKLYEIKEQQYQLYHLMERLTDATRGAARVERMYEILRESGQQSQKAMDVTEEMLLEIIGQVNLLMAGMPPVPPVTLP